MTDPRTYWMDLEPSKTAPAEARDWARSLGLPDGAVNRVLLVLSELVTNSVQHARGDGLHPISVRLSMEPDVVRIEVWDFGGGVADRIRPLPAPEAEGGRGLYIVQEIAERWGVAFNGSPGVWAEVRIPRSGYR